MKKELDQREQVSGRNYASISGRIASLTRCVVGLSGECDHSVRRIGNCKSRRCSGRSKRQRSGSVPKQWPKLNGFARQAFGQCLTLCSRSAMPHDLCFFIQEKARADEAKRKAEEDKRLAEEQALLDTREQVRAVKHAYPVFSRLGTKAFNLAPACPCLLGTSPPGRGSAGRRSRCEPRRTGRARRDDVKDTATYAMCVSSSKAARYLEAEFQPLRH